MLEIWKDCPEWENYYEVSNFGNIRSKKRPCKTSLGIAIRGGNILNKYIKPTGYECVSLSTGNAVGTPKRKQELVHKLVLLAFVGERPYRYQACHNDGCKTNNHLTNLRWDSVKNNHADKHKHGTCLNGSKNPTAKLTEEQAKYIKYSKKSVKEVALECNVSFGCADKIRYGASWKHL